MAEDIVVNVPLACKTSSKIYTAQHNAMLTDMSTHGSECDAFLSTILECSHDCTGACTQGLASL